MAAASGCSLARSRLPANRSRVASSKPETDSTVTSSGLPSVSVPVLSTTSVSTLRMTSNASAFLNNTPKVAPRPVPTMMDIGVANPRAQGQAMIRTATAFITAKARRGSGPQSPQTTKASTAISTTAGTK